MTKAVKKKSQTKKTPTQQIEYKISLEDLKSDQYKIEDEKAKSVLLAGKAKKMLKELFEFPDDVKSFIIIASNSTQVMRHTDGDLNLVIAEIERAKLEMLLPFVEKRQ